MAPLSPSPHGCADRRHHLHVFGDMVYTSGHEMEDRDVPFAERRVSDLRAEFVALATQPGANRRELCQRFRISAPTGYKWLHRYAAEGPAGLRARSRRPRHSPARTAPAIERAVLALRTQHPTWGGRKLRVRLALWPWAWPSADDPGRPLALRPRPGRLPQPAHRHRAGSPGHGLPALRPARSPAGRQRQSLGQPPRPSLYLTDGLAAPPGHRRQPQPAVPSPDPGQG